MISFIFIVGTRFFTWGSQPETNQMRCGQCGHVGWFTRKRGMSFITLFFIIPVIPISGVTNILQCSVCRTRYQVNS